jgi:hypothetical protein
MSVALAGGDGTTILMVRLGHWLAPCAHAGAAAKPLPSAMVATIASRLFIVVFLFVMPDAGTMLKTQERGVALA